MDIAYLYAEMVEYNRTIVTKEELLNVDKWHTNRKFDNEKELEAHLEEKELKVSEGFYTANNKVIKGRQGYSSVFYYNKAELFEHQERTGGVSGFTGKCYSDWLYFDLESHINPEDLKIKVSRLLDYLISKQISYKLYFSGSRGLHLYIPMKYVSFSKELEGKANIVCKAFSKQITKQFPELVEIIDPQVYAINTCLRMPFTINPKSGLLKTIMIWTNGEFKRLPNDIGVFETISNQMLNPDHEDIEPHWVLDESFINCTIPTEIKFDTYFPCPYGEKACIWKMFNTKLKKGDHRNDYGIRLMSFLKNDKEFPNSWVWAMLQQWNKDCLEDPLTMQELQNVFRGIETYNYNLCKDPLMNKFCTQSNNCQFWVSKNTRYADNASIVDAIAEKKELAKDLSDPFDLSNIFEGMQCLIKPNSGKALSIVADKKVGKTMLAILIALKSKKPTVLFSAEIGRTGVLSILELMLGLTSDDPLDAKAFLEATKHIFIIDRDIPAFQNIPMAVAKIERNHKVKISLVIFDYLQLIKVYDENTYNKEQIGKSWIGGKYVRTLTERMDTMAGLMPEMVKQNGWLFIATTQPTKGVGQEGRGMLLPDAGKGGQSTSAMFDYIMLAWRPFKNANPEERSTIDNVISLWLGANRWGEEDIIRNYEYIGNRRLVGRPHNGIIKQLPPITPTE